MKEQELRKLLHDRYGEVPQSTHAAFMNALAPGKEERKMKKKMLWIPALAMMLAMMLVTAAVAATMQVLDWYYTNRFTNVQPDELAAILDHTMQPTAQTQSDNADFDAVVQEVSWLQDENRLIVALNVMPKNPSAIELHPMWNLDPDGSYVGGDAPLGTEDGEDRGDHWLLTEKGFGPVAEMMLAPEKILYLVDVPGNDAGNGGDICWGGLDAFDMADGSVQFVLEYDLSGVPAGTDAIDLMIPYYTVAYTEDDEVLYVTGRQQHWVQLTVSLGD